RRGRQDNSGERAQNHPEKISRVHDDLPGSNVSELLIGEAKPSPARLQEYVTPAFCITGGPRKVPYPLLTALMRGLFPRIHASLIWLQQRRGWPARGRP